MGWRVLIASLLVIAVLPTGAIASLAGEQRDGRNVVARLHAGDVSCAGLSAADLDHVGEYAMGRALGSTTLHQAMNDRMRLMLGAQREERMHELLGARYTGCGAAGGAATTGSGMMGTATPQMMLHGRDFAWMTGGGWRAMSRSDWQRLEHRMLGGASGASHGMSGWAVAGVTLAAAAAFAALAFAVLRRRAARAHP